MLIYNIHSSDYIQFGVLQLQELGGGLLLRPPSLASIVLLARQHGGKLHLYKGWDGFNLFLLGVRAFYQQPDLVTCSGGVWAFAWCSVGCSYFIFLKIVYTLKFLGSKLLARKRIILYMDQFLSGEAFWFTC